METKHKFKRRNENTGRWQAFNPKVGKSFEVTNTFVTFNRTGEDEYIVFTHLCVPADHIRLQEGGHNVPIEVGS